MDIIYHWIGFLVVWLSILVGVGALLASFYVGFVNYCGRRFRSIWGIVEFQFYKKEFKEWVKNKKRHPKMR